MGPEEVLLLREEAEKEHHPWTGTIDLGPGLDLVLDLDVVGGRLLRLRPPRGIHCYRPRSTPPSVPSPRWRAAVAGRGRGRGRGRRRSRGGTRTPHLEAADPGLEGVGAGAGAGAGVGVGVEAGADRSIWRDGTTVRRVST